MKIYIAGLAAALMATAAFAQTTTPAPAPAAPAAPEAMTPATPPADAAPAPAADTAMGSAPMLTERGGKWYNGDKPATKTEISAYKKSMKTPH